MAIKVYKKDQQTAHQHIFIVDESMSVGEVSEPFEVCPAMCVKFWQASSGACELYETDPDDSDPQANGLLIANLDNTTDEIKAFSPGRLVLRFVVTAPEDPDKVSVAVIDCIHGQVDFGNIMEAPPQMP
jgi:hypothetical protein